MQLGRDIRENSVCMNSSMKSRVTDLGPLKGDFNMTRTSEIKIL